MTMNVRHVCHFIRTMYSTLLCPRARGSERDMISRDMISYEPCTHARFQCLTVM